MPTYASNTEYRLDTTRFARHLAPISAISPRYVDCVPLLIQGDSRLMNAGVFFAAWSLC